MNPTTEVHPSVNKIDSLPPGAVVILEFRGGREELAMFCGMSYPADEDGYVDGSLEDSAVQAGRRAKFVQVSRHRDERFAHANKTHVWEAYRYKGRWVYGSSAETLKLARVVALP